jgi:hypothetical protein
MTFQPGESGNPAGRPRGSRNKKTLLLQALLRKVLGMGKMGGDVRLRQLIERTLVSRFRSSPNLAARPMRTSESKDTSQLYNSSAAFEPEVRNRTRGNCSANFGFAALAPRPRKRIAARRGALQCSKRGEALVNINENTSAVGNGDAVPRGLKKAEPLEIFAKKRARAEPMQCSTNNRSQGDNKGGNKQATSRNKTPGNFSREGPRSRFSTAAPRIVVRGNRFHDRVRVPAEGRWPLSLACRAKY